MARREVVENRVRNISLMAQFEGYSSQRSIIETPLNTFRTLQNSFVSKGIFKPRKATTKITLATPNNLTSIFLGFFYFVDKDGEETLVYKVGTTVGRYNFLTDSYLTLSNLAGTARVEFIKIQNMVYLIGDFAPQKLNYDEIVPVGLTAASSGTLTKELTGNWIDILGTYEYVATWVRDKDNYGFIEGNTDESNFLSMEITSSSGERVKIDRPSSVPAHATHWRVYRRFKDTGGPFFLIADQINGNTDHLISVFDILDDGNPAHYFTGRPVPTLNTLQTDIVSHMAWWRNKLWFAYNDVSGKEGWLLFSLTDQPDAMPSDNIFLPGDASDKFVKLLATESALIILKEKSIWRIDGIAEQDFILTQVFNFGAVESEANIVGLDQQTIYFINEQGIWEAEFGRDPDLISLQIQQDFDDTFPGDWSAVVDERNGWVIFSPTSGTSSFVFSPKLNRFIGKFDPFTRSKFLKLRGFWGQVSAVDTIELYDIDFVDGPTQAEESSFTVSAALGMNLGTEHGRKKLFRNLHIFDQNEDSTGTVSINSLAIDIDLSTLKTTAITVNNTDGQNLVGLGISKRFLSLGFSKTSYDPDNPWAIVGIDIEFEEIGNW